MRLNLEKQPHLLKQASLLITVSGLASKILAAIYRIPYQNLVGDRGFYAYQQVYPFLAIISALSLTALPNLVASLSQKKDEVQLTAFMKLQLLASLGLSLVFFLGHQQIAEWMGAPKLGTAIYLTSLILLTVPFISFYRGLAQADLNMGPTAISQILEQIIRVAIIMLAAICYVRFDWSIYRTATVAASGNLVASGIVLAYLAKHSSFSLRQYVKQFSFSLGDCRQLGQSSFVFILFSIYLLLFQLLDSLFVKNSLVNAGYSNQLAEISKGIFDRGQPLIQFGLIFSTALFTSYLPKLTQLYHYNQKAYQTQNQDFLAFLFYFNVTLTAGFMSILHLMNRVLFQDNKGWLALVCYLLTIILSSTIQFFHQKCFIENRVGQSLAILLIGLACKLGLTPLLTYHYGIVGSSLSTVIPLFVVFSCYILSMPMKWTFICNGKFWLTVLLMVSLITVCQAMLPLQGRLGALINLLLSTGVGFVSFWVTCRKSHVFDEKLWSFLPFKE
uniref:oligosaccharide flippase family protein n=1 Tax=Streptococcus canis TaxID=1329 RepID=UPI0024AD6DCD|nr:oligosaccharide flippase family protein [Streptococcus canis]